MKKKWKIFAIVCGSLAGLGLICCIIAFALGFRWEKFMEEYPEGIQIASELPDKVTEEIKNTASKNDGRDAGYRDDFEETFQNVDEISIELCAGIMNIELYDGTEVKVVGKNVSPKLKTKCYMEENELKFETDKKAWDHNVHGVKNPGEFTIYIPETLKLKEMDIEIGAGELMTDGLKTSEFGVSVGAGEAEIVNVEAGEADIDCGVGSVRMEGTISGDIDIKCGIGEVALMLNGKKEEYNYEVSGGIGNLSIAGESYEGLGKHVKENHHASKKIEISGGVGEITIDFR